MKGKELIMMLTTNEETVLSAIFSLGREDPSVPVALGAIHNSFFDMDVRELVGHLGVLIDAGLVASAGPGGERMGNGYRITPRGIGYCSGRARNSSRPSGHGRAGKRA